MPSASSTSNGDRAEYQRAGTSPGLAEGLAGTGSALGRASRITGAAAT